MRNKDAAVIFIRTLKGPDHIFFIQSPVASFTLAGAENET